MALGWRSTILAIVVTVVCSSRAAADSVPLDRVRGLITDGDLIFQPSTSPQSTAVQAATGSRYTHVGLVFGVAEGHPFVLEAVQPVRKTPLALWIRRGTDAHFVLMRPKRGLALDEARKVRRAAERFVGRDYDALFEWSDERIYCSELVWKAYATALGVQLGELEPWRALNLADPHVKALAKQRLGRLPDPDALVITPVRIMTSPLLEDVVAGELRE